MARGVRAWGGAASRALSEDAASMLHEPRESDQADVVIVGGGPSGLSMAIRLRQLCAEKGEDLRVCLLEKGAEVGAHIVSGCVLEPRALAELFPDWKERGAPLETPAGDDSFLFLTETGSVSSPVVPPQMHNKGNYVVSLSQVTRWLAEQAEELGVEVYPGTPVAEAVYAEDGQSVVGVATADVGIGKDGLPKSTFGRGFELHAPLTVFAEGCRGSASKQVIQRFHLDAGRAPQTYGIGIKEVWQVDPSKHHPGRVMHTVGWPLDPATYGGSFLYHFGENLVSTGFVVGLDYQNPYLSPYREFQRWKHHPAIASILEGGECLQYGARALVEGGVQSLPQLHFPGGVLVGDSAGFLNVPKIKGVHTAMKSGMLAAEAAFHRLVENRAAGDEAPVDLAEYEKAVRGSWVYDELHRARNVRPMFAKYGLYGGLIGNAIDTFVFFGRAPFTLSHAHPDHEALKPAADCAPIEYPAPDGKLSFALLESVSRSGTNHEEDQPAHLKVKDMAAMESLNRDRMGAPESRYCPAGVYEWVDDKLVINAQNCVHCKTCDIKDPGQNIQWTTPEGGGPLYSMT